MSATAAGPALPDPLVRPLDRFERVELAELLTAAELLTRFDRKYLLDVAVLTELLERLDPAVRVLDIDGSRHFRYESVYFDTPALVSYHDAARRRTARFKVRTRAYLDSGTCALEVKTRDHRGHSVKVRTPYAVDERGVLTEAGLAFVAGFEHPARYVAALQPTLRTAYRRTTLLLPAGNRVTLDVELAFTSADGRRVEGGRHAVVESKSVGHPTAVDRVLWSLGHRPIPFSKYAVGMGLLHPGLAAHRWNRTLRQAFGWQPEGHPQPARRRAGPDVEHRRPAPPPAARAQ
ncbi:MAG: polyphosphate polymerase domain-containing protein [Acidimicrobiia bacterium]